MTRLDLHSGFKYDEKLHTLDDLVQAAHDLFQVVFSDMAAAARGAGEKVREDPSWPAFRDHAGDRLSDCGVPYATIKKVKLALQKGGSRRRPK